MFARDLRVGDQLWLSCLCMIVTVSGIRICSCGYLELSYLETAHRTEVHRETALVFQNGRRVI